MRAASLDQVEVQALRGVSFNIEEGEMVAVMGPSGCGKTTLLSIMGCLDTPTSGSYYLDGVEVSNLSDSQLAGVRNRKIGPPATACAGSCHAAPSGGSRNGRD